MNSEDYFLPSSALQYGIAHLQMKNPVQLSVHFYQWHCTLVNFYLICYGNYIRMGSVEQMLLLEEADCQDLGQAPWPRLSHPDYLYNLNPSHLSPGRLGVGKMKYFDNIS